MAIRLRQAGVSDFIVAERADSVGGTWRDNRYPGCACDVQSHVYSFSHAPIPHWTRMFARQPEICAYLGDGTQRFGIPRHLRFDYELASAVYDDTHHRWQLSFANGQRWSARVLISGTGGLSRAAMPNIPGIETFRGKSLHSQHWDHGYPLDGKRVAVIGTGASASGIDAGHWTMLREPALIAASIERCVSRHRTDRGGSAETTLNARAAGA
jgi:cation diffusion facilitator CzcD-associated flavoprotein CzcO